MDTLPWRGGKPWTVACRRCFETSDAYWQRPGNDGVEILLYLLTIPLFCIPALLYSGFRSCLSRWTCRVCGSPEVVPTGSRWALENVRGEE